MTKQRMATADVAAELGSLRWKGLVGMRVINVYDVSPKVYVLKLARSGEDGEKVLLLVESGMRFHTISTMPPKADAPSNFTLKLRKHIRSRRLVAIQQLGADRIVQLSFGGGGSDGIGCHLLLEFYAAGNVILTDDKYQVLTLLRSHRDDAKGVAIMARHPYPIHTVRLRVPVSMSALEEALRGRCRENGPGAGSSTSVIGGRMGSVDESEQQKSVNSSLRKKGRKNSKKAWSLKDAVAMAMPLGALAAEHCIVEAGLDPARVLHARPGEEGSGEERGVDPLNDAERDALLKSIRRFEQWLDRCENESASDERPPGGCIVYRLRLGKTDGSFQTDSSSNDMHGKRIESKEISDTQRVEVAYDEFHPLLADGRPYASLRSLKTLDAPETLESESIKTIQDPKKNKYVRFFDTFDDAVSEFFGKIADQRAAEQRASQERAAEGKLEAVRRDHELRIAGLEKEAIMAEHRAIVIEANLVAVDAAINAVRDALADGMDWGDLARMIETEKVQGNPVAQLVDSIQLEQNMATLILEDVDDNDGDRHHTAAGKQDASSECDAAGGEETVKTIKIGVDITLSAHANARAYYDVRRRSLDKLRRTREANAKALEAAERKAVEALQRAKGAGGRAAASAAAAGRKPYWWERFNWFISSENYLVLSGRDAQQNELLVKRHMRKGDVYVHADLHGASSTIIKNPIPTSPIPPLTLTEAGAACVCRSAAWDAKIVTSAWWVHSEQVSKTAPTGEYLTTGSFMIRGRKNYLPPQPLVMGIAWLFKLEEGSIARHLGERAPRGGLWEREVEAMPRETKERGMDENPSVVVREDEQESQGALEEFMDASIDVYEARSKAATETARDVNIVRDSFARYGLSSQGTLHRGQDAGSSIDDDAIDVKSDLLQHQYDDKSEGVGAHKRHLSAKERQLLKKGIDPRNATKSSERTTTSQRHEDDTSTDDDRRNDVEKDPSIQSLDKRVPQQSKKKQGRGKKAVVHWEDSEDEKERAIAAALYGKSGGSKKDRKHRKEERKARLAARKAAASSIPHKEVTNEEIRLLTARLSTNDHEDGMQDLQRLSLGAADEHTGLNDGAIGNDHGKGMEPSSLSSESRESAEHTESAMKDSLPKGVAEHGAGAMSRSHIGFEGHGDDDDERKRSEGGSDMEEDDVMALLAEEGIDMLEDAVKERLTQLDELTGCPKPGDVLLAAVPVCAPYSVLTGYTYRVKLVPGTLKKGKAYKQAVEMVAGKGAASPANGSQVRNKDDGHDRKAERGELQESSTKKEDEGIALHQRERALIKAVPEMEGTNAIVGAVRLQVAGLQRLTAAAKKSKKGSGGGSNTKVNVGKKQKNTKKKN